MFTKSTVQPSYCDGYDLLRKSTLTIPLVIPALLTERGLFSHQIYRADVNHRDIDYFVLNNEHTKGRAIRDSFCNPVAGEQFDMNSPPVLLPHAMVSCEEDVPSQMKLKSQKPAMLPHQSTSMNAFIDGKMVAKISNKDFTRLLAIFGFEFVNSNRTPCKDDPTAQDLIKFLAMFKSLTLKGDGFSNFLKAYKFEKLFVYDYETSKITNIYRFGWLLRSLSNIRFSACEGQHRWWCFSSFIQGLPIAQNELPLPFAKPEEFVDEYASFDSWQIHYERNIVILHLNEYSPQSLAQCKRLSDDSRKAQNQSVDWCLFSFLSKFCNMMGCNWETMNCRPVGFENYWDVKVDQKENGLQKNLKVIWESFKDHVDIHLQNQKTDLVKSVAEWNTIKRVGDKAVEKADFKFSHSVGWTKGMLLVFYLLKCFCDKKESMFLLPSIDAKGHWEDQRLPNQKKWIQYFRKMDFLLRIKDSVDVAAYYLELRSWVEQELVSVFRNNYLHFKPYLRIGKEVPVEAFIIDGKRTFSVPAYADRFKRSTLFPKASTSHVLSKVLESSCCLIYQDIFRAIEMYGFDPKLFSDKDIEGLLGVEAHEVFDTSKDDSISEVLRKNYCLKMFLNWRDEDGKMMEPFTFSYIDTTVPGAKIAPKVSKTARESSRFSKPMVVEGVSFCIDTLLVLYPYYVKVHHEPFMRKLQYLEPYLGFYSPNSKKSHKMENGLIMRGTGFDPAVLDEIKKKIPDVNPRPPFDMFVDNHLLFTHFIRDIKNGSFNTDTIQPFMAHVAHQLGCTSDDPKLDLQSQFDGWQSRVTVSSVDELDEIGDMKIIEQHRTPKSSSKEGSSTSSQKKAAVSGSKGGGSSKKVAKAASKGAPHSKLSQAFKHEDTKAMDMVQCLARLAYNYQQIGVEKLFNVSFRTDFLSKRNMKNEKEKILWNQALKDFDIDPHFPEAGLGGENEHHPFTWNKDCLVLTSVGSPVTRTSPSRSTAPKILATELENEKNTQIVLNVLVSCSDKKCETYTEEVSPMLNCTKCRAPVHEECSVPVDFQVWCRKCQVANNDSLQQCEECTENWYHLENGFISLDGKELALCRLCFEKQDQPSQQDEIEDDGTYEDEDSKENTENKESKVEESEYACCSKKECICPNEAFVPTEHNLCKSCNGHCHIECFALEGGICQACFQKKSAPEENQEEGQPPCSEDDNSSSTDSDDDGVEEKGTVGKVVDPDERVEEKDDKAEKKKKGGVKRKRSLTLEGNKRPTRRSERQK